MPVPPERTSREIRSGRINRRPPSFAVTLVALAIVFAIAWMFFVRSGSNVPTPQADGISGTFTWQPSPGSAIQKGSFGAVASGNAGGRSQRPDPGAGTAVQSAYQAATRTGTAYAGGERAVARRTVGAWPPVWRDATHSPLDYQGLSAIVRAAAEDGDHAVGIKPLKQGDRTVWRAAMRMDGKVVYVVVDQQTGLVTWESDGAETFAATVSWASPPAAGTTYHVDAPAGTPVKKLTAGAATYATSPAAAGRAAGYDPLVSDLAPDGYALKAVASWKTDYAPVRWLSDKVIGLGVAGPSEPLVAQLYTRGLGWFTMEQTGPTATKALGAQLGELLASAKDTQLSFQQTTLQYGAFKGATASTWYQPSGPSLFIMGARRAVFITGALTRQELIAYAEGLKPVPADAGK
jgi:hypothetical protein